jgi:hypothetical protein
MVETAIGCALSQDATEMHQTILAIRNAIPRFVLSTLETVAIAGQGVLKVIFLIKNAIRIATLKNATMIILNV